MDTALANLFCGKIEAAKRADRWGIGRASGYLRGLGIDGELLKEAEAKLVYSDEGAVIGELGSRVYEETGKEIDLGDGQTATIVRPVIVKAKALTEGSIMEFTSTLTTIEKDRDGDILEPKGARVDMMGPLLWNHLSTEPIGKIVKILTQNNKRLVMRFAIADTPLGRDIAQLVEFGALRRMSHGFIPEEYEEMKKDGEFIGWRVLKYEILEASIVSVASNRGAIISAMEHGKLAHPLVKGWATNLAGGRPVVVAGHRFALDGPSDIRTEMSRRVGDAIQEELDKQFIADEEKVIHGDPSAPEPQGVIDARLPGKEAFSDNEPNQIEQPEEKAVLDDTESGGLEAVPPVDDPEVLTEETAEDQQTKGTVPSDPPGGGGEGVDGEWKKPTLSDFTDKSWDDLSAGDKGGIAKYYAWYADLDSFGSLKLPHHFPASGKASLNGVRNALARAGQVSGIGDDIDKVRSHLQKHLPKKATETYRHLSDQFGLSPHEVDLLAPYQLACFIGRSLPQVELKSGRTLSKANEASIREAKADCDEIAGLDNLPRAAKALATRAAKSLESVLESAAAIEEEGKAVPPADEKHDQSIAAMVMNAISGAIQRAKGER